MAVGFKGRDVLILVEDAPAAGTFTTLGGLRTTSWDSSYTEVDVTSKDNLGAQCFLEGAGTKSFAASFDGVNVDGAPFNLLRVANETNAHIRMQVVVPITASSTRTYEADFSIPTFTTGGDDAAEVTYSFSANTSGVVTIT